LRGLIGKNDTFHTNIQINGPKLVWHRNMFGQ